MSTAEKKYGWKGWKMPIFDLDDPNYCEHGCPVCTGARKGHGLGKFFQGVEMKLTGGGCWWGKAREKKYGVKPNQPLPKSGA
jgi:hypothetical protein